MQSGTCCSEGFVAGWWRVTSHSPSSLHSPLPPLPLLSSHYSRGHSREKPSAAGLWLEASAPLMEEKKTTTFWFDIQYRHMQTIQLSASLIPMQAPPQSWEPGTEASHLQIKLWYLHKTLNLVLQGGTTNGFYSILGTSVLHWWLAEMSNSDWPPTLMWQLLHTSSLHSTGSSLFTTHCGYLWHMMKLSTN